uniref:Ig-like domain-containing protein n=1 Tax=Neogobius melanostomus TaxID=47308 RepID=A0A8C6S1U6_9GOBI
NCIVPFTMHFTWDNLHSLSYFLPSLLLTDHVLEFTEGDTANISCCWEHVDGRTRVTWMKNMTNIQNYLLTATSNVQSKCSFLTIANITMEHSGTYICTVRVEIPVFKHVSGNGTTIRVLAKEKTEETKENGTYFCSLCEHVQNKLNSSDHEDSNGE